MESISISICNDNTKYALSGWEVKNIANLKDLESLVKNTRYSNAIFENNYRNSENAKSFNNLLIYDVDNDKDAPKLSLESAFKHIKSLNINALIVTSKSHNIEKNGYVAERYRIIIPVNKTLSLINKNEFRDFQKLCAKRLGILDYIDKKALNDKARYYDKSPANAISYCFSNAKTMDIKEIESSVLESRKNKLEKLNEIKANEKSFKIFKKDIESIKASQSENLSYLNNDGFNTILENYQIADFVRIKENINEEYTDSYQMLKTDNAKYAVIESANLIHDFKSGETYNIYTYLGKTLNTNNANAIAREFENITGHKVLSTNIDLIKTNMNLALKNATNDKTLESNLKSLFKVNFVKFHHGSGESYLQIADRKITNLDFKGIVDSMKKNREKGLSHAR